MIQATSAYTVEFLALAAALKPQMHFTTEQSSAQPIRAAPVKSDAQSIVFMIKERKQRLRQCTKDHHLLLQYIDNALNRGCSAPVHVRSHAERQKIDKDWDSDDWGNFLADRAANKGYDSLCFKGFTIIVRGVTALSLCSSLLENGQW